MKTSLRVSWLTGAALCSLSVIGNINAGSITFSPQILTPQIATNGDVNLIAVTGPTVNSLNDGFSLSRSYTMDATKNGNGTATWTATRNFDTDAKINASNRISGDTTITFGTGQVLFTVQSTVFDVNSGKINDGPKFQVTLKAGATPVTWDMTKIISGIEKSTAAFDDTLSLQSSVLWTNFLANDRLTVESLYSTTLQSVPEPSSWLLMGTGILVASGYGWRKWVRETVSDLGFEQTVHPEGRPRKASQSATEATS